MVSRGYCGSASKETEITGLPPMTQQCLTEREVIFRPTKKKIKVELFVKHDVALGELLTSQRM